MGAELRHVKILRKPEVTELAGEKVMIDFESGNYVILKGAANDIWDLLGEGVTVEAVISGVMGIYEVEEAECRASTVAFLEQLEEAGFIEME